MIQCTNISKSFDQGKTWAIRNISININRGETLVILGSSGSGKSTFLKILNRLVEPDEGQITLDGLQIESYKAENLRRNMGYVFQKIGLFPHMTIEENISIVMRLKGIPLKERRMRSQELLTIMNLNPADFSKRYPQQLSGGEAQRVGVARALAAEPACLLMDEPFGALDALTRASLQDELIKLKEHFKKTIVFVTHDIQEAFKIGDRIAVLHEGQLHQVGNQAEISQNPATSFVEELVASSHHNYVNP